MLGRPARAPPKPQHLRLPARPVTCSPWLLANIRATTWAQAPYAASARDVKRDRSNAMATAAKPARDSWMAPPNGPVTLAAEDVQRKTSTPRRWMRGMNRVFARPPPCGLATDEPTSLHTATSAQVGEEEEGSRAVHSKLFREQQAAATTIQACFRRHLARRALRALRSLVKMQAFARGAYVRKQADVAIRCMNVLVRLQVRVRARQVLNQRPMT